MTRKKLYLDTHQLLLRTHFISHQGKQPLSNVLAMNLNYDPILSLRKQIEQYTGLKLNHLIDWNKEGEAHVTCITPVEYDQVLSNIISMNEIEIIAKKLKIQESDLKVIALGSAQLMINGKVEKTFFLIVKSDNLIQIRKNVFEKCKIRSVDFQWDPLKFFPHVTIGYTLRDLHENDGIIKNKKYSLDNDFQLIDRNDLDA